MSTLVCLGVLFFDGAFIIGTPDSFLDFECYQCSWSEVHISCRSFIPLAFDRVSHDLLVRYARREREASLQQYNVTYTCSATVPADVALLILSTHSLGALHASGGVPAACAYLIGKVVRLM